MFFQTIPAVIATTRHALSECFALSKATVTTGDSAFTTFATDKSIIRGPVARKTVNISTEVARAHGIVTPAIDAGTADRSLAPITTVAAAAHGATADSAIKAASWAEIAVTP